VIPGFGVEGAAVVTVATEALLALSNIWIVRDYVDWGAFGKLLARLALPAAVVAAAVPVGLGRFPFPVGPVVAASLLGFLFLVLRLVTPDDLKILTGRRRPANAGT
jgi:O-antigen/teichoic acid export membrane protein